MWGGGAVAGGGQRQQQQKLTQTRNSLDRPVKNLQRGEMKRNTVDKDKLTKHP